MDFNNLVNQYKNKLSGIGNTLSSFVQKNPVPAVWANQQFQKKIAQPVVQQIPKIAQQLQKVNLPTINAPQPLKSGIPILQLPEQITSYANFYGKALEPKKYPLEAGLAILPYAGRVKAISGISKILKQKQATGGEINPLIQEARKYKSVEEFVSKFAKDNNESEVYEIWRQLQPIPQTLKEEALRYANDVGGKKFGLDRFLNEYGPVAREAKLEKLKGIVGDYDPINRKIRLAKGEMEDKFTYKEVLGHEMRHSIGEKLGNWLTDLSKSEYNSIVTKVVKMPMTSGSNYGKKVFLEDKGELSQALLEKYTLENKTLKNILPNVYNEISRYFRLRKEARSMPNLTDFYNQATGGVGGARGIASKIVKPTIQTGNLSKKVSPEVIRIGKQQLKALSPTQKSSTILSPSSLGAKLPSTPGSPSGGIISQKDKYAFNINKGKLQLNPEEKAVLDTAVKSVRSELSALKGKTVSNSELLKAAKESEILQKTVTRDQTMQAEAALLKARQRVVELDKDITQALKTGNTGIVQEKMREYVDLLKVVSSNAADRGRQLQSLAVQAGDESVRSTMIKDILKVQSNTDEIIAEASKVNWENANAVAAFYRKYIKPSKMNILDEFRYNNMLSNPRTHIRNAFSNLVQTFITRPATLVAQARPIEAIKYYGGVVKNIPDAFDEFIKSFKGERPIMKPDIEYISTMKLPKFMTIPTRAMEAGDIFFQTLIKGGERARGATEIGAKNIAEYSLFRQGLRPEGQGKILSGIDSVTEAVYQFGNNVPVFRWFVPFVRTPMNFAKQWLEYSPAGITTMIGAGNKREQLAKAVLGSVVVGVGAKAALEDRTTWAAPTDPKQKELFYASGRKPYSIKIGNKWVSMQYAGPFALALALPAAAKFYTEDSRTALTDNQMDKLGSIIMASAEYLSGQTFLEGMGNFVKMASGDVDYTFKKNVAYTASQFIPLQGLVRWISTVIDPVYRRPKGMIEQIQSNIPVLSKGLEAYTMPNGEPSTRERVNLLTPYDITPEKPEYNQSLQERQQKLQQNAVINKVRKKIELEQTGSQKIGDQLIYWNAETEKVSQKTIKDTEVKAGTKSKVKKLKKSSFKIKSVKVPKIKVAKVKKISIPKAKKVKKYKVRTLKMKKVKLSAKLT